MSDDVAHPLCRTLGSQLYRSLLVASGQFRGPHHGALLHRHCEKYVFEDDMSRVDAYAFLIAWAEDAGGKTENKKK